MIRRKTLIRSRKRGTHLQLGLSIRSADTNSYNTMIPEDDDKVEEERNSPTTRSPSIRLILTTLQYYDKKEDVDKVEEERNSPTTRSLPSTRSADTNYITILLIRRKTMIRSTVETQL